MTPSHIFANLFHVWFIEGQLNSHIYFSIHYVMIGPGLEKVHPHIGMSLEKGAVFHFQIFMAIL